MPAKANPYHFYLWFVVNTCTANINTRNATSIIHNNIANIHTANVNNRSAVVNIHNGIVNIDIAIVFKNTQLFLNTMAMA